MRRRLTLPALAAFLVAVFSVAGHATAANAGSSAPSQGRTQLAAAQDAQSALGWNNPG